MATTPKTTAPSKRKRRAAGRPDQNHSVGGDKIVESALQLLKTTSPEKLTVVEVAAHARVDPALVRYYFGDKKGVLHAAAKRLLDQVQDSGRAALGGQGTFRQRVRHRLEVLIRALEDHPRFLQLVINEVYAVDADSTPDAAVDLRTVADRGLALTRALLEAGDEPKLRDVDARYLHVAILGICTFFMEAKPLLNVLFESRLQDARMTSAYIDFATELLTQGLLARPEDALKASAPLPPPPR